ncbi:MAG: ABC transporter permease [Bacteroidetes bacterium]|nr:ABC transporter permease [Bacteroidota bacterium]MCL5268548.1 ABC transporter permease [Bacteroidota bacterium]
MPYPYFVAKRLLRSRSHNRFVSFLTFFATIGLAIGTSALLITVSILNGFQKQISENVSNFTANIEIRGFEQVPLPGYQATLRTIDGVKNVKSASPFVSHEAMIRVHRTHYVNAPETDGILLKGILPGYDNSSLRNEIRQGRYDLSDAGQMSPLIIGEKLARRLEVNVGDTVFVFGIEGLPSPLNPPRVMSFVVTGIYETGMSEYDDLYGYTNMKSASYLFDMPSDNVTGFDVMVKDMKEIGATSDTLQNVLGYPYYPRTMYQMYRNLFAWIQLQKKPIPIIIALIIIVATFNIVGTLLMIVLEKMNAVGVLKTLGATRGAITRIFLAQGAFIGALGTLLGSGLSYVLLEIQKRYDVIHIPGNVYFMNTVPVSMHAADFILIGGVAFTLSLLASYLPARAAASLDPLESVRFY